MKERERRAQREHEVALRRSDAETRRWRRTARLWEHRYPGVDIENVESSDEHGEDQGDHSGGS